jgi:hypothetical protein
MRHSPAQKKLSRSTLAWIAVALLSTSAAASAADAAAGVDARAAFEMVRSLTGDWTVEVPEEEAENAGETAPHTFRRSANDSVVMETMFAGTEHEMINMYHLDGDDLVLTHYCAGGNQPRMKLDQAGSTAKQLHFKFIGGTNLDAAKDAHIHAGSIAFVDDDHVVSTWIPYQEGEQAGVTELTLARAE